MGRPEIPIDVKQVERLAAAGLTVEEIAAVLDCGERTVQRRFGTALKRGRARMKASLKRKQFHVAMKGSVPMLIWLGKQHLAQSDKHDFHLDGLSDEELLARAAGLAGGGGPQGPDPPDSG